MQPLRVMQKTIPATVFNHARLAILRLGPPVLIELAGHRGLSMFLYDGYWACVEQLGGDRTIMVWDSFDLKDRSAALFAPVTCELSLYHYHAGLVMGSVLDETSDILASRILKPELVS